MWSSHDTKETWAYLQWRGFKEKPSRVPYREGEWAEVRTVYESGIENGKNWAKNKTKTSKSPSKLEESLKLGMYQKLGS